MRHVFAALCLLCALSVPASASSFRLDGVVTQSTADGTGPAVSNGSLNAIVDLQPYSLTLNSSTAISGPGQYDLTGSSLAFGVLAAAATESNFGAITLSVTQDGSFDDFSLLACLNGADCLSGNALTANFQILATMLNGTGVAATGLDQPHPLELLEDDGTTDVQGSILNYTGSGMGGGTPPAVTPEPGTASMIAVALSATGALARFRKRR